MSSSLDPRAPAIRADQPDLLRHAKTLLRIRKLRDEHFRSLSPVLAHTPAYVVLLDLYVSHRAGESVAVTNACIASGLPTTTGLRLLDLLEQAGAVVRSDDLVDRRRRLVALSEPMIATIERHLAALEGLLA